MNTNRTQKSYGTSDLDNLRSPIIDRADLRILENKLNERIDKLVCNLSNLTQKVTLRHKKLETKLKTFENTVSNTLLSRTKHIKNKSVSTRRSKKGNLSTSQRRTKQRRSTSVKSRLLKALKKSQKLAKSKKLPKPKSVFRNEALKTNYSHDDYVSSESEERVLKPIVSFGEEVTPMGKRPRSPSAVVYLATDQKSKSIHLADSERQFDRRYSNNFQMPTQIHEEDTVRKQILKLENNEYEPAGFPESTKNTHCFPMMESGEEINCSFNPIQHHKRIHYDVGLTKANTVDVKPTFKETRKSRYEEIRSNLMQKLPTPVGRVQTYDKDMLCTLGKENDRNERNVTFAYSDSHQSTMKSAQSLKDNKKLQKLERLYSELSQLEKSMV